MSLCQLIHKEIQKISGLQVDVERLSPGQYIDLNKNLAKQIEKLEIIQKLLNLKSKYLDKIDGYFRQQSLDVNNIEFTDLFAYNVEKVTDRTVFYLSSLNYLDYETFNPNASSLPEKLKYIFGDLWASGSQLKHVELSYLFNGNLNRCTKLSSVYIELADGFLNFQNSKNISRAQFGEIGRSLDLINCEKLTIELKQNKPISSNITCTKGEDKKIKVGGAIYTHGSGIYYNIESEIQKWFDVTDEQINRYSN